MKFSSTKPQPTVAFLSGRAPRWLAALALVSGFAPTATLQAQTMQWFGDWEAPAPGAVQLYVSANTGAPGNPGTLAAPLQTITQAMAAVTASGALGTVPVTINVLPGTYDTALGEVFPILLPAHGICIESYTSPTGAPAIVNASGALARETFFFDTLGALAMPDSVLRGLEITNDDSIGGAQISAEVRIEVPLAAEPGPQRVAPEIRQCTITGGANAGIAVLGTLDVALEPVIERNRIFPSPSKFFNPETGVLLVGGDGPQSALVRSNEIWSFPVNLSAIGGALLNQPRIQANFIQVGEVNVSIDDCAPFVVGNTIAFAFSQTLIPTGIQWINVPTMTLANNLIWNPAQPASGMVQDPIDVSGTTAVFAFPVRACWFNYDQDGTLAADPLTAACFSPAMIGNPSFVGGDVGGGLTPVDLHLSAAVPAPFGSPLRELGLSPECFPNPLQVPGLPGVAPIPGVPPLSVVRRDHAFDIDFDARVTGGAVDIGADEVTGILGANAATSITRGATLTPTVGSATGSDIDMLGNLSPSPLGLWSTEVDVNGTAGDLAILISGVGFMDFITDPAFPGVLIENTAVYQNLMADGTILPGMSTLSSISVDLGGGSVIVGAALIPAGGPARFNVNFGGFNQAFNEAEAHLQAVVLDGTTLTLVQATNRLSLDLNE